MPFCIGSIDFETAARGRKCASRDQLAENASDKMRLANLILLGCLAATAAALDFEVHDHKVEGDAREAFTVAVGSSAATITRSHGQAVLQASMRRAWWDLTADVVEAFRARNIDLGSKVMQQAASMKRELTTLADKIAKRKKGNHG